MKKSEHKGQLGRGALPQTLDRGSALLIVLGFLSFMMISAVSFAIFMRIERQASSNYRHTMTARHLLNAGLNRAIDEVDRQLKTDNLKFPNWPGRVYPGAAGGDQATRVLSLEALSFIPGILVNDVRYYAPSAATWRQISMPIEFDTGENAFGGAEVGRYAFACVNLSDMLNINAVDAALSGTNRVSIGHLFESDAVAATFEENRMNTDLRYETMQDFYACMYGDDRKDPTFKSPFHNLLETGDDIEFDNTDKHILVPDSFSKTEPGLAGSFVLSEQTSDQPVQNLETKNPQLVATFQTALGSALVGGLQNQNTLMANLLADYLDADQIPKRFDMPSVEMAPMVSQIFVGDALTPIIKRRAVPDTDPIAYDYYLQLPQPGSAIIEVEVVWPFKNSQSRTALPSYTVEVQAWLTIKATDGTELTTTSFAGPPSSAKDITLQQMGSAAVSIPANVNANNPDGCYQKIPLRFTCLQQSVDICRSSEDDFQLLDTQSRFTLNKPFCVALVLFATIKTGNEYVDIVPHEMSNFTLRTPYLQSKTKLFFKTKSSQVVVAKDVDLSNGDAGRRLEYVWKTLECPDPRFNYRVSNWINSNSDSITVGVNASTTALLGKEGRDGDIFMTTSDTGIMRSPGELGFLIRPFVHNSGNSDDGVDFATYTDVAGTKDYANFFRTIRLYDHGGVGNNQLRDNIYQYITSGDPDAASREVRVNPLSDIPNVLVAAIYNTPVDYYQVNQKLTGKDAKIFNPPQGVLAVTPWANFTNSWYQGLLRVKANTTINAALDKHLSQEYGNRSYLDWYAGETPTSIFSQDLGGTLNEVDRKMLYSWSLDNFSDRQQLFLYVFRAEVTVPSFGGGDMGGVKSVAGGDMGGVKSVAGGRAVALVWRDPYPVKYPDTPSDPPNFHEHKILFFKQLDN